MIRRVVVSYIPQTPIINEGSHAENTEDLHHHYYYASTGDIVPYCMVRRYQVWYHAFRYKLWSVFGLERVVMN